MLKWETIESGVGISVPVRLNNLILFSLECRVYFGLTQRTVMYQWISSDETHLRSLFSTSSQRDIPMKWTDCMDHDCIKSNLV